MPPADRNYMVMLMQFIKAALDDDAIAESYEAEVYKVSQSISSVSVTFCGSKFGYIYIERIKFLVNRLYFVLTHENRDPQDPESMSYCVSKQSSDGS